MPDALSRYDMEEVVADLASFIDLDSDAFEVEDYMELKATIDQNSSQLPDLKIVDKFVYKRTVQYDGVPLNEDFSWKLCVPLQLTREIIENAHCPLQALHGGFHKTLGRIKEYFYWPNMNTQVRAFFQQCQLCKETKQRNQI